MFLAWLLAATVAAAPIKVALLPCETKIQATEKNASWLDSKLREDLGAFVHLIPVDEVRTEMKRQGVAGSSSCDDRCLSKLGKALGADRAVGQILSFQRKEQVPGGVWIWTVHQVEVKTGRPYGRAERAWVKSARSYWELVSRKQAEHLAGFDPKKRLRVDNPGKAKPTKGPVEIPNMVYVPSGEFIMGSEWGELDEEPRHKVYLDAYYIDKYEVTNEEYEKCIEASCCERQSVQARTYLEPKKPAVAVGFDNAVAYCEFAGKRLPTEAEWEKAARGTDERRYPWGNEWNPDWVNMRRPGDGFDATAPVGSFPENVSPYGAYDMAGNAWEWTQDYYSEDYYEKSEKKNPKGPDQGVRRVMRGGSWCYDVPLYVTAHNRSDGRPWIRKKYVGFRCAKDVP